MGITCVYLPGIVQPNEGKSPRHVVRGGNSVFVACLFVVYEAQSDLPQTNMFVRLAL